MKPLICGVVVAAFLLVAVLASGPAGAQSDGATPSIKSVMKKLHSGKNSPQSTLKTALKGNSPDWPKVQKAAKLFATLGAELPKNDPPRGGKESYEKLAKEFASAGKTLDASAEKEDLKGSRDAFKKISGSCAACHKDHKPN